MPTVTVEGSVTLQQAATALQDKLGSRYEITTHGSGTQQALKVKQSAASTATVHLDQDGNATTFHVHGGGLVSLPFRRHLYYATYAVLVSIPSSYSDGVRYPSPF